MSEVLDEDDDHGDPWEGVRMACEWVSKPEGGGFRVLMTGTLPLGKLRFDGAAGIWKWGAGLGFDAQGRLTWSATGTESEEHKAEEKLLVTAAAQHPEAVGVLHQHADGQRACGRTTGLMVRSPELVTCQMCLKKAGKKSPSAEPSAPS